MTADARLAADRAELEKLILKHCDEDITATDGGRSNAAHLTNVIVGAGYSRSSGPSQVLVNAQADANYRPYCIACSTMSRMTILEPLLWKCLKCGAMHDERLNGSRSSGADTARLDWLEADGARREKIGPVYTTTEYGITSHRQNGMERRPHDLRKVIDAARGKEGT